MIFHRLVIPHNPHPGSEPNRTLPGSAFSQGRDVLGQNFHHSAAAIQRDIQALVILVVFRRFAGVVPGPILQLRDGRLDGGQFSNEGANGEIGTVEFPAQRRQPRDGLRYDLNHLEAP